MRWRLHRIWVKQLIAADRKSLISGHAASDASLQAIITPRYVLVRVLN